MATLKITKESLMQINIVKIPRNNLLRAGLSVKPQAFHYRSFALQCMCTCVLIHDRIILEYHLCANFNIKKSINQVGNI